VGAKDGGNPAEANAGESRAAARRRRRRAKKLGRLAVDVKDVTMMQVPDAAAGSVEAAPSPPPRADAGGAGSGLGSGAAPLLLVPVGAVAVAAASPAPAPTASALSSSSSAAAPVSATAAVEAKCDDRDLALSPASGSEVERPPVEVLNVDAGLLDADNAEFVRSLEEQMAQILSRHDKPPSRRRR